MGELVCRVLPFASGPGPWQMAADEAMLESAAAGVASLRFYEWAEPTLSLGYFQPAADRLTDERLATLPWLRRASGGAALVHDREITYALAVPAGRDWQRDGVSWVCLAHAAIAAALARFDVAASVVPCGGEKKLGEVLCFLHQTPGDLICEGHKIAGSAQRKRGGALLQHGGVLLASSPHAPRLPGVFELTEVVAGSRTVREALRLDFAGQLGWRLADGDWTAEERARIDEAVARRYSSPDWNNRR